MSSPFRGLRAPHSGISWTHYIQMLGLYEKSLVPAIEAVVARQPAVIVDVSSHWGYYALGLAMRCFGHGSWHTRWAARVRSSSRSTGG